MASFPAVLQSEWTKIRSVRSTVWTLLLTFVITLLVGGLASLITKLNFNEFNEKATSTFDATGTAFSGILLGELAIIVFGVLAIGNEYSSGMIRVSLAAVPQRGTLLVGKAAVLGALALVVSVATAFVTFFVGQALLGDHSTTIGSPGVLRAVCGAALYLTMLCLFSAGVTTMLHNQTLALGVLVPFFFLLSPILSIVPWVRTGAHYFPDYAGSRMLLVYEQHDQPYGPWTGFFICLAWTAAAILGGILVLKKRDA
ncbi:ABC-type transport system involved in multi-copper enzyme maturation permease subunit [Kitasatospora gansuensis]|uniref:ABC-type transport system involved in multi-copper enzyme maturation permease subunit n=1 Tax=Kitasatospora gansuensis TaxID=258050 RepID=A0A7W7WHV9_9ACTN|nr:ABC transporter permease subunit [Kitasatospora gansuensis]MBB4946904.1 ABC-type transport system involved in multi-copper enzyme maturation permease subunit [Kitasatospora gansuensis]